MQAYIRQVVPRCARSIRTSAPQSRRSPLLLSRLARSHIRTFHSTSAIIEENSHGESMYTSAKGSAFQPLDTFPHRHIGPSSEEVEQMLKALDPSVQSIDEFVKQVLPADILSSKDL